MSNDAKDVGPQENEAGYRDNAMPEKPSGFPATFYYANAIELFELLGTPAIDAATIAACALVAGRRKGVDAAVLVVVAGAVPLATIGLKALIGRRPVNVAATAVAHKTARALWAMLTRAETYRRPAVVAAAA